MNHIKNIAYNQQDLAKDLGVTNTTICRWQKEGTTPMNELKILNAITDHLKEQQQKINNAKEALLDKL